MINYDIELDELLFDFEAVTEAGIDLTSEQINRAGELSETVINPEKQWQTYLNALALFGFTNWLEERDASIGVNSNNCSVTQPNLANYIDGVFNLEVGDFKVCLLTNGVAIDELVTFPRAILDLPEYTAHFYVLVNVVEERAEVKVDSFIRYDEIIQRKNANNLTADADWTYEIPLTWFNSESNDLLLYLRCLNPEAIPLPESSLVTNSDSLQGELEPLVSQLQTPTVSLSEVLTWEQGAQLFTNPNLLSWLYQLQTRTVSTQDAITDLKTRLSRTVEEVGQKVINVKSWLSNELDNIAENLAWNLLPAPAFAASAFRDLQAINRENPIAECETVLRQLRDSGEDIPSDARGAFQDFDLANYSFRVFAVTWEIEEIENVPEWSLLIVLGARVNSYLPQDLKLEIKQEATVLDEKIIEADTSDTYLYSQVIGEMNEHFTVSITLANGGNITFSEFIYQ